MIELSLSLQRAGINLRRVHIAYQQDCKVTEVFKEYCNDCDCDQDDWSEQGYVIERDDAPVGLLIDWGEGLTESERFDTYLFVERSGLPVGSVFSDSPATSGNNLKDVLERFLAHPAALPHLTEGTRP